MKTNVVITALNAADPQSQAAHARMRPLLEERDPASSSDVGCVASGAAAEFIRRCYPPMANRGRKLFPQAGENCPRAARGRKTAGGPLINCINRTQRMTRLLQLLIIEF